MNLNVSLTGDLVQYVKGKVDAGLYASPSDVVADALRMLEERDYADAQDIGRLKRAWHDGVESADFAPLDLKALKAEGRTRIAPKSDI